MLDLWAFWGEQMAWEGLILERNAKKKEKKKKKERNQCICIQNQKHIGVIFKKTLLLPDNEIQLAL